ncbi:stearoyl-[acyl-carrier-protein] 9-desaturase 1, chloroplastic-like [Panicum miliaceum]|uniref:Stearoyl-[acyl-carrier-protein] 9-desaturase 1, chloroplastic-like n=1 Tax=Panicum miliaceum TaxID=4540 RepID=A0A3L6THB8_PANMI|nr:stearoyl-[acyl-carrier-protein] 9-desaturase 1, chloroplastic-like [Panicum miliaceum]
MAMMPGIAACCVDATGITALSPCRTRAPPRRAAFFRRRMISAAAMTAPEKAEVLRSLDGWAETNLLPLLKPVERSWQPHDLLPDSSSPGFREAVDELRARAREIPDDYYVCLVGNMVTEEALPTYHAALNSFVGYDSPSSADAWARWSREWTAEENRHGDLLNRYLYLCGRVDLRRVEQTIHHLIAAGMRLAAGGCPYRGFIYTAFQERATAISHGNTARRAAALGDASLARVCGAIAGDERRHEAAYTRVVAELFRRTPDAAVRALGYMMRERILMPAHHMFDGRDAELFRHYAAVAHGLGVYTTADYAGLVEFFVERWGVAGLGYGLTGEGRRAQEYVCRLPERVRRMDARRLQTQTQPQRVPFSWVFDRQVELQL